MFKYATILIASLACGVAFAQSGDSLDIVVTKPGSPKTTIDVSRLKAGDATGQTFRQVLGQDLKRSGWFRLGRPGGPGVYVGGDCASSGGKLVARVDVRHSSNPGASYLRRTFSGDAGNARALAHAVADAVVAAVAKRPGIASTRIVMIGSRNGRKDLYMCDADGQNFVQVTRDRAVCLSPRWGPEGRELVYTSFVGGYPDVYRIDLQSFRRRRVVSFPGLNTGAAISPDRRQMVLTLSKDGNPDLYLMTLSSRRIQRLTRTPNAAEASPTWSPDGRQMAYVSDRFGRPQVYVMSVSGEGNRRITFSGSENVAPDWGPGNLIVCSSRREGRYQLVVVDPTGKAPEKQITSEYVDHESPSWARDGRHIVCTKTQGYQSDVYILDTLGDPAVRLTTLQGDWYAPDWSPN